MEIISSSTFVTIGYLTMVSSKSWFDLGMMGSLILILMGSISVSGQLPTYPSPNPTLILTCYQLTVVEFGEGKVGSCPDIDPNDLTTGLLSAPNSGKGENSLIALAEWAPVTCLMSISNTSGSKLRRPYPKQNGDTIFMKNVLQRWINLACISGSSFLVETLVLNLPENVSEYYMK